MNVLFLGNENGHIKASNIEGTPILFVLNSICSLFQEHFPEAKNKLADLTVFLCKEGEDPMCYRKSKKIFLYTDILSFSQAAYQFSHELCHYMIPDTVCQNLGWLEESICETASYYFLKKLTIAWKNSNVLIETSKGELYADFFTSYVEKAMSKATPFDILSQQEINLLKGNRYLRLKNKYIATLLLPIFGDYKNTWLAVPYLCRVSENNSFNASLQEWLQLSPSESRLGLERIIALFFPESV